jgi:hypothetical protein
VDHAVQLSAFAVVLNVPLEQAPQVRSAVGDPALVTYEPEAHVVHATHAVDGLPS